MVLTAFANASLLLQMWRMKPDSPGQGTTSAWHEWGPRLYSSPQNSDPNHIFQLSGTEDVSSESNLCSESGEMAHCLRECADLAKDSGSVPSTHSSSQFDNCSSKALTSLPSSMGTYPHSDKHIHLIKNKI